MPRRLIALLTTACLAIVPASAETVVRVAFGFDRPPYVYRDGDQWRGIEYDTVVSVFSRLGYRTVSEHMNSNRLSLATSKLGFDAAVVVVPPPSDALAVRDVSSYYNVAVSRVRDNVELRSVADLAHYDVVAWQGATHKLGDTYAALYAQRGTRTTLYDELPDQTIQNRLFWQGRYQVIVVDRAIFQWQRRALAGQFDTAQPVRIHDLFQITTHNHVVFRDRTLRDRFEATLQEMRRQGEVNAIVHRYLDDLQMTGDTIE